ncbi:zinc protease [Rhodomicrobium udaipurense JA643]|uniref:Insulinase family protein n=2 Tax=Rhodomicrobium udaipurense TaxID=1202716 RepID=A0A8I1G7S4_9HYPH|nr:zinc protease [Rhodomicrobium udaipurense JA643]MBJ7542118.1 insulinase family protein [Rhodomicrobium udaipurense]
MIFKISGSRLMKSLAASALFVSLLFGAVLPASAMQIQKVVSKKGIEAWLVEDHSRPILSLQFAFKGGSTQDPDGKSGVATFVSGMLDEGAGDLDSSGFQKRLEELAAKMSFSANYDNFSGSFQTLTQNREDAIKLLRASLNDPHFDADDANRIREQLLANLRLEEKDPDKVSSIEWYKLAFGAHPYGRSSNGTVESIESITPDDLKAYRKRIFARDNLKVAVVGDIDAKQLGDLLDTVFGDLPEKGDLKQVPEVTLANVSKQRVVAMPNPQSVVQFGFQGLKRKDPDFIPAFILNYVVGGGGFSSKLMQEVREKRGLAYGVYTYLYPLDHAGIFAGGVATENKSVAQSLDLIRAELERVSKEGLTETELQQAKDYLIGSYALRFDTSGKIAAQLLAIQLDGLGADYIERRNGEIEAVTVADVKRVAKRLLEPKNLIVTVVGEPEGVKEVGL